MIDLFMQIQGKRILTITNQTTFALLLFRLQSRDLCNPINTAKSAWFCYCIALLIKKVSLSTKAEDGKTVRASSEMEKVRDTYLHKKADDMLSPSSFLGQLINNLTQKCLQHSNRAHRQRLAVAKLLACGMRFFLQGNVSQRRLFILSQVLRKV